MRSDDLQARWPCAGPGRGGPPRGPAPAGAGRRRWCRSRATTSPPSRETAKPGCARTRSSTSSGPSSTGPPGRSTVTSPPASSDGGRRRPVHRRPGPARTSLTASPRRGPSILKLGTSSKLQHLAELVGHHHLVHVELVLHHAAEERRGTGWQEHQSPGQGLAHLDPGLAAGGPAERGEPPGQRHLGLQLGVDGHGRRSARRCRPLDRSGQSARWTDSPSPAPVSSRHIRSATNGQNGASSDRHRHQHLVQGGLGGQRVAGRRVGVGAPEPPPAPPHVPVGEVVHQRRPGRWPPPGARRRRGPRSPRPPCRPGGTAPSGRSPGARRRRAPPGRRGRSR